MQPNLVQRVSLTLGLYSLYPILEVVVNRHPNEIQKYFFTISKLYLQAHLLYTIKKSRVQLLTK